MPIPIEKKDPVDLDDLFEDEDFKGPNEDFKALYARIQRKTANRQHFLDLGPGQRADFLIYLVDSFKVLLKQGTVKYTDLNKQKSQRLDRLIDFVSAILEPEETFRVIQQLGLQIMKSSQLDEHPGFSLIAKNLGRRIMNRSRT